MCRKDVIDQIAREAYTTETRDWHVRFVAGVLYVAHINVKDVFDAVKQLAEKGGAPLMITRQDIYAVSFVNKHGLRCTFQVVPRTETRGRFSNVVVADAATIRQTTQNDLWMNSGERLCWMPERNV